MKIFILLFLSLSFLFGSAKDSLLKLESTHKNIQKTLDSFEIEYKHITYLKTEFAFEVHLSSIMTNTLKEAIFSKEFEPMK